MELGQAKMRENEQWLHLAPALQEKPLLRRQSGGHKSVPECESVDLGAGLCEGRMQKLLHQPDGCARLAMESV